MLQKIINWLNDLRPRQLLILAGVAGLLMFLTIIVAMNLISKQEVAVAPPPPPVEEKNEPVIQMKSVVVAKVNIPPRTRIQENMLQMKELPVDMVPEGAIDSFDSVKGVQVKVSIFSGDVLTVQKVFSESKDEGFAIPFSSRMLLPVMSWLTLSSGTFCKRILLVALYCPFSTRSKSTLSPGLAKPATPVTSLTFMETARQSGGISPTKPSLLDSLKTF